MTDSLATSSFFWTSLCAQALQRTPSVPPQHAAVGSNPTPAYVHLAGLVTSARLITTNAFQYLANILTSATIDSMDLTVPAPCRIPCAMASTGGQWSRRVAHYNAWHHSCFWFHCHDGWGKKGSIKARGKKEKSQKRPKALSRMTWFDYSVDTSEIAKKRCNNRI